MHYFRMVKYYANSFTVKGTTALHYAAAGGYADCFYCLLHHEASLGICNLKGENALDMARKNGNSKAIGKACMCMYQYNHNLYKIVRSMQTLLLKEACHY